MENLIFIVDDNDTELTTAAMALEEYFPLLTMPSAEKMFYLLEKKRPKLIILDVEMPDMDGFEAMAKLRKNLQYNDIKVIFITGMSDKKTCDNAMKLGATDVINKPYTPLQLLNCVQKHIAKT
ncbi:MAG: response regulator [Chitinivibrionia bacterium]|nr:response regulator [Chitinivibrionia bacterium]